MTQSKIAILVDSCTDVPSDFIKAHQLFMVPLQLTIGGHTYADKVEITPEAVYRQMPEKELTTSTPKGETILATFEQIKAAGYTKVLGFCISSKLSGTFQHVKLMGEQSGLQVTILDTKSGGIGSGLTAMYAAELVENGMDYENVILKAQQSIRKTRIFFYVPTLAYLAKGGRIGKLSGMVGNLLNVKPIISVDSDGAIFAAAKARGEAKALAKMLDLVADFIGDHQSFNLAVPDGDNPEQADLMAELLSTKYPQAKQIYRGPISPVIGVHTGPGLVGVGVQLLD